MNNVRWAVATLLIICLGHAAFAKTPGTDRYSFDGENGERILRPCSRKHVSDAESIWKPSESEIEKFESQFDRCVHHKLLKPLSNYYRQYVGFKRGKSKFIYLSATLKDERGLQYNIQQPEIICDGTEAAFGVTYEISSKSFHSFEFNGPTTEQSKVPAVMKCD